MTLICVQASQEVEEIRSDKTCIVNEQHSGAPYGTTRKQPRREAMHALWRQLINLIVVITRWRVTHRAATAVTCTLCNSRR